MDGRDGRRGDVRAEMVCERGEAGKSPERSGAMPLFAGDTQSENGGQLALLT